MSCIISPIHPSRRWTHGRVPYAFESASFGGGRNAGLREIIMGAITTWNGHGLPVQFVPRSFEPSFILFTINPIPNWPGLGSTARSSASQGLGMVGGLQPIYVALVADQSTVMHEMGHAVGLDHEQNREDREGHVDIEWINIDPLCHNQFFIDPIMTDDVDLYDFASLMHYDQFAYSRNGQPTIRTHGGEPIGLATDLSAGDIAGINFLYNDITFATIAPPAFAAFSYPSQIDVPQFMVNIPPFDVTPPKLTVSPPKVKVGGRQYSVSSFEVQPPAFTVSPPPTEVDPPNIPLNQPPYTVTPPPIRVKRNKIPKRVTLDPPPMRIDPPAVTVDPPPLTVTPPSMKITPPSFKVTPPSFRMGPVTVRPPEMMVTPPEMTVNPPSVIVDPPPVTLNPPPLDADPPPFKVII